MARYQHFEEFIKSKKEKVESKDICNIPHDLLSEGNRIYSNWGQTHSWSDSDYNHSGFCVKYFQTFFSIRARLVHQILTHCQSEELLPGDIFEKNLKVVSFGCGPGNDLVGFESFYLDVKTEIVQKCFKILRRHMRKLPTGKCKKQRYMYLQSLYVQSQERKKCRNTRSKKWAKSPTDYTSSRLQNYRHVHCVSLLSRKKLQKINFRVYRKIQACYART